MRSKTALSLVIVAVLFSAMCFAGCDNETSGPEEPAGGTIETITIEGLNIGGWRNATVYLPPSYDPETSYPVVYVLHGFSGDENSWVYDVGIVGILDGLIAAAVIVPMIVVMPDGSNILGGSFWVNSYDEVHDIAAYGNYSDYLIQEVVGAVDTLYNTIDDPSGRAISGLSMGGYGAFRNALDYPDVFGSVGCHSGPIAFYGTCTEGMTDLLFPPDPAAYPGVLVLTESMVNENEIVDGELVIDSMTLGDGEHDLTAMFVAMSFVFSPNKVDPNLTTIMGGMDLPLSEMMLVDADTNGVIDGLEDNNANGVIDGLEDADLDGYCDALLPDVWDRWLNNDILNLVLSSPAHQAALAQLNVYFDCGLQDELTLNNQSDIVDGVLQSIGVDHTYNTFDGGHSDQIAEWIDDSIVFHSEFFSQ